MTNFQKHLFFLKACHPAREWAGSKTARQAWEECENPTWMYWWAGSTKANTKKQRTKASCEIARLVLHLVKDGEVRPLRAIEAVERWLEQPTEENVATAKQANDDVYAYFIEIEKAEYQAYTVAYLTYTLLNLTLYDSLNEMVNIPYLALSAICGSCLRSGSHEEVTASKKICDIIRKNLVIPWEETE